MIFARFKVHSCEKSKEQHKNMPWPKKKEKKNVERTKRFDKYNVTSS